MGASVMRADQFETLVEGGVVGVDTASHATGQLVARAAPNPSTPRTTIRFDLARQAPVSVTVHDAQGRLVRTLLADHVRPAGAQAVTWDGTSA